MEASKIQKKKKKGAGMENINSKLALTMKSGKANLGYKATIKSLRQGKSKLVLIASNCPPLRKSEIEYYAMLAKTAVHHYSGSEARRLEPDPPRFPSSRTAAVSASSGCAACGGAAASELSSPAEGVQGAAGRQWECRAALATGCGRSGSLGGGTHSPRVLWPSRFP